jgi:hypothetical protein
MLIDINSRRIAYGLRICNRYCVSYRLRFQRLPHSFHHRKVQAFNTTRSRHFLSFFRDTHKVAEKKPEVLQETEIDRKDGGDLQLREQKFAKEVDERILLDLNTEEHTVAESHGKNVQRSLPTDTTVQVPSEPDPHSEQPNNAISREAVKDTEALHKELESLRETQLSIVDERPDLEPSSNFLSHDLSSEDAISNLHMSTEDLAPLLMAEARRNKMSTRFKAAAPINSESIAAVDNLIAVEEPTASSQMERDLGEGGFCSEGVMNAPEVTKNEAGIFHTNNEPINHSLAQHRSDEYSAVRDQPLGNVDDSHDILQQPISKGLMFDYVTQNEGRPVSLSSLNQILESAMQEPSTADSGEKFNVISGNNKPLPGPIVHPKLIVKASVEEGVNQEFIEGMMPQTAKELDSSLKAPAEYHAKNSSHGPAIIGLEAETKSYATFAETCLAASLHIPNSSDFKYDSSFSLPQLQHMSWKERVMSSKTSPNYYLNMLDAYSLFLACRHTVSRAVASKQIIDNELGSLAFRTLFNNASRESLIRSLMLLRRSRVFAHKDRASLLFPGLFNQADIDTIDARRSVAGESISEPTEEQCKTQEDCAIAGIQTIQKTTAVTPPKTILTCDQTQVTQSRTVIDARGNLREDTTSSLADSLKARLDVILRSLNAPKVPVKSLAPWTPTHTMSWPPASYLVHWENFAQIVGRELLDQTDAYSLYLFFQGRPLNTRTSHLIHNHSHIPELQAIVRNNGLAVTTVSLHVLRHYKVFQYAGRLEALFPSAARPQAGVFRQSDESMGKLQCNASLRKSPDIVTQSINVSKWDSGAYANTLGSAEAFRLFTIFKNKPLEMVKSAALITRYQNYPPLRDLIHKTYNSAKACYTLSRFITLQFFDYPERVAVMFPGAICDVKPIPREDFFLPVSAVVPTSVQKVDHEDTTTFDESRMDYIKTRTSFNIGNSEGTTVAKSTGTVCNNAMITRKRCIEGIAITTFSDTELSEKTGIETAASTISIDEDIDDFHMLSVIGQDCTMAATKDDPAMFDKGMNDEKPLDLASRDFTVWISSRDKRQLAAWHVFNMKNSKKAVIKRAKHCLQGFIKYRESILPFIESDKNKQRHQILLTRARSILQAVSTPAEIDQTPTSIARHGESAASNTLVDGLAPFPSHDNAPDSDSAVLQSRGGLLDLTDKKFTVWIAPVGSGHVRAKWLDFVGWTNRLEAVNKAIYHLKAYITGCRRDIRNSTKRRTQRIAVQRLRKANRSYNVALAESERISQYGRLDRMRSNLTKTAAIDQSQTSLQKTNDVMKNAETWFSDEALVDNEILREARKLNLMARPRKASEFALSDLKFYIAQRRAAHRKETDISKRRLIGIDLVRANHLISHFKRNVDVPSATALREEQNDWQEHHRIVKSRLQLKSTLNEMRGNLKKIRETLVSENPSRTIGGRSEIAQLEGEIRLKEKELNGLNLKIRSRVVVGNGDVHSNDSQDAEDPAGPEASGHAEDIDGHVSSFAQVEIDNAVDAAPHSVDVTESIKECVNLPFTIQHMLLGSILDDFKREIFRYGNLHFPDLLPKVGWHCAESVGITHFQKMVTQGRLPSQQRPFIYLDSNHFLSFVEELESLRLIRNAYAHETAFDAVLIKQTVADMINLAKALDAPHLTSKMRRFHEDLVAFLEQSEEAKEHTSSTLHSRSKQIQAARSRLDQEEIEAQHYFALKIDHSGNQHSRRLHRHVIESLESRLADIRSQYKLDEIGETDDAVEPTVWRKTGLRRPAISRSPHHSAKRPPQPNVTSLKIPEIKDGLDELQSSLTYQKMLTKADTPTVPQCVELIEAEAESRGVSKSASSIIQQSRIAFSTPIETPTEVPTNAPEQPSNSAQVHRYTKLNLNYYGSLNPNTHRRLRIFGSRPRLAWFTAQDSIAEHSSNFSHDNCQAKPTTQDNVSSSSGSSEQSSNPQALCPPKALPRHSQRRDLASHGRLRKILNGPTVKNDTGITSTEPSDKAKTISGVPLHPLLGNPSNRLAIAAAGWRFRKG